jgi:hypothetical protein
MVIRRSREPSEREVRAKPSAKDPEEAAAAAAGARAERGEPGTPAPRGVPPGARTPVFTVVLNVAGRFKPTARRPAFRAALAYVHHRRWPDNRLNHRSRSEVGGAGKQKETACRKRAYGTAARATEGVSPPGETPHLRAMAGAKARRGEDRAVAR